MKTRLALPHLLFLILTFSACAPIVETRAPDSPTPAPVPPTFTALPTFAPPPADEGVTTISNGEMRFIPVHTDLTTASPIDIPLSGKPVWIAGIPYAENSSVWAIVLEDGSLQAYQVAHDGYAHIEIIPNQLSPSAPLTISSQNGQVFALTAPADASPLIPPVLLDPTIPKIAYIATNGDLVIWQGEQGTRLPVNALPDSRILVDSQNRLLLLSNPTERYTHAVLGDAFESTGITLVETNPEPRVLQIISIPEPDVIEGIYPIWADMNTDGQLEIIVTLSNTQNGARIVAFREDGSLLAEGPAIGTGYRWRHQLLVAPFGASGESLLAVVRTPHIGGIVEFYRLNGDKLEIVTEVPGISTHSIGSRNLFTAQAGDFNNDGLVELLAPDQSHTRLGIVGTNREITWIDLNVELITNLAAVLLPESRELVFAAGLSNNTLRIWLP